MRRLAWLIAVLALGAAALVVWDRYRPRAPAPELQPGAQRIDRILVEKSARRLTAFRDGKAVLHYDIALGFAPVGDKHREGDGKTPEGVFRIDRRNQNSAFHLSLGLDYPHPDDIDRARAAAVDPGGDIFIHGQPNGSVGLITLPGDWTAGCIAVSNKEIETLWRITPLGTEVEIRP